MKHPILLALICNLLWATSYTFQKQATLEITAQTLLFYRFFLGFITLLPYIIFQKIQIAPLREFPVRIVVLGFLIYTIGPILQILGISMSRATDAGILASTEPLFAILIAFFFLGERLRKIQIFGAIIMFGGVFSLSGGDGLNGAQTPALLILLSVLIEASQGPLIKPMLKKADPAAIAFCAYALSSLFSFPMMVLQKEPLFVYWNPQTILSVLVLGILCTSLAYTLWYQVLSQIDVSIAILFVYTQPLFATLIAWGYLGEIPGKREFISLSLIIFGLFFVLKPDQSNAISHDL